MFFFLPQLYNEGHLNSFRLRAPLTHSFAVLHTGQPFKHLILWHKFSLVVSSDRMTKPSRGVENGSLSIFFFPCRARTPPKKQKKTNQRYAWLHFHKLIPEISSLRSSSDKRVSKKKKKTSRLEVCGWKKKKRKKVKLEKRAGESNASKRGIEQPLSRTWLDVRRVATSSSISKKKERLMLGVAGKHTRPPAAAGGGGRWYIHCAFVDTVQIATFHKILRSSLFYTSSLTLRFSSSS